MFLRFFKWTGLNLFFVLTFIFFSLVLEHEKDVVWLPIAHCRSSLVHMRKFDALKPFGTNEIHNLKRNHLLHQLSLQKLLSIQEFTESCCFLSKQTSGDNHSVKLVTFSDYVCFHNRVREESEWILRKFLMNHWVT